MTDKLYESKKWLELQYKTNKKTAKEIGKMCGANESTIYRSLVKHGIISK